MECVVHRVPMRDPGDASAVLRLIDDGLIAPHEIVAILGKTEGNGCVNDFTRGYATMALSAVLAKPLGITVEEVPSRVAIVMSGGTEGGLSPHFLVFAVRDLTPRLSAVVDFAYKGADDSSQGARMAANGS
jgi:cyanuric acid amidohydrolase